MNLPLLIDMGADDGQVYALVWRKASIGC